MSKLLRKTARLARFMANDSACQPTAPGFAGSARADRPHSPATRWQHGQCLHHRGFDLADRHAAGNGLRLPGFGKAVSLSGRWPCCGETRLTRGKP